MKRLSASKAKSPKRVLEKTVKAAVRKRLNELGAWQNWPVPMGLGEPMLDCVGCYQGFFFSVETKAPGKRPTLRQQFTIGKMRAAGGRVFVIDSVEGAKQLTPESLSAKTTANKKVG